MFVVLMLTTTVALAADPTQVTTRPSADRTASVQTTDLDAHPRCAYEDVWTALDDLDLTADEQFSIESEVKTYLELEGDRHALVDSVRLAIGNDCRGDCVEETIQVMNRGIRRGMQGQRVLYLLGVAIVHDRDDWNEAGWTDHQRALSLRQRMSKDLVMWQVRQGDLLVHIGDRPAYDR